MLHRPRAITINATGPLAPTSRGFQCMSTIGWLDQDSKSLMHQHKVLRLGSILRLGRVAHENVLPTIAAMTEYMMLATTCQCWRQTYLDRLVRKYRPGVRSLVPSKSGHSAATGYSIDCFPDSAASKDLPALTSLPGCR